ncbi:hypothetical protein ES702_04852 [subsurface metagenome]
MAHIFISYVRNNKKLVQRLYGNLEAQGVIVWLDLRDKALGVDWRQAIRRAIQDGAFFIACFSKQYHQRKKTYMNEELTLAIDELRQRPTDATWFIPVKLNNCKIPDLDIGAGRTLQNLEYVKLYKNWDAGIKKLLDTIQPIPTTVQTLIEASRSDDDNVRIAAIEALGNVSHTVVVPVLIDGLYDENWFVHKATDKALRRAIRQIGKPAVPALIHALGSEIFTLGDENWGRQIYVASLLKVIDTPEALKAVEKYENQKTGA